MGWDSKDWLKAGLGAAAIGGIASYGMGSGSTVGARLTDGFGKLTDNLYSFGGNIANAVDFSGASGVLDKVGTSMTNNPGIWEAGLKAGSTLLGQSMANSSAEKMFDEQMAYARSQDAIIADKEKKQQTALNNPYSMSMLNI